MALKAQDGIRRTHAATIVNNLYQSSSCIRDHNAHMCSAGVYGILHKFLDHGGRSLDHLPRGYHVCYLYWKYFEFPHCQPNQFCLPSGFSSSAKQRVEFCYEGLGLLQMGVGALVMPVAQRALDVSSRNVFTFLPLLVEGAVDSTESASALLFRLIIVDRPVIEYAVFVVTEKIKESHIFVPYTANLTKFPDIICLLSRRTL